MKHRSLLALALLLALPLWSADLPEYRDSPMELVIPVGRLDLLPKGAAWTSIETAKYMCDRAVIKSVQIGKRDLKDGKVELEFAGVVTSEWYLQDVGLDFELLANGERIAAVRVPELTAGSYSKKLREGARGSAKAAISSADFAKLFAEGATRQLRVTLRVLDTMTNQEARDRGYPAD